MPLQRGETCAFASVQYYIDEGDMAQAKAQIEAVLAVDENNRTAHYLLNLIAE